MIVDPEVSENEDLPFRIKRYEYQEHLLNHAFTHETLLDEIWRMLSVDDIASIVEYICRMWSIPYPDQVTRDDLFKSDL